MTTEVTLQLPEKVYREATRLAQLTNRDVGRLLAETIELGLSPLGPAENTLKPVAELSDEEVLAVADLRMREKQGRRMGKLLQCQQAGDLSDKERRELFALLQIYQEACLRKAQGYQEAVRRGLRERLDA